MKWAEFKEILGSLRIMIFGVDEFCDTIYIKQVLSGPKKKVEGFHPSKTNHAYARKFWPIHFVWKYRFFVPLLTFMRVFFGRYKVTRIPKKEPLDMLRTFRKVIKKTNREWIYRLIHSKENLSKKELNKLATQTHSCRLINEMTDWIITVCLYDNAYREWMIMFFLEMTAEVNKKYQDTGLKHIIHNTRSETEVEYLNILQEIQKRYRVARKEDPK